MRQEIMQLHIKKAKPEEKEAVLEENLVAVICADVKGNMKDPDSFDLREVWCDLEENRVAIEFGGKNGFGGIVSSFAYYEFDKDEQDYEWQTSVSDLMLFKPEVYCQDVIIPKSD